MPIHATQTPPPPPPHTQREGTRVNEVQQPMAYSALGKEGLHYLPGHSS